MLYADMLLVSGNWMDDMRHGHGRYRYVNGDIYDGEWSHHVRHGTGQYTYATNGIVYSGTWEYGRRVGTGSISVLGRESTMKVMRLNLILCRTSQENVHK